MLVALALISALPWASAQDKETKALLQASGCMSCHAIDEKVVGPAFQAIAAKYALERHGLKRVAIVDFDVHHGNGTEDIVAGDDRSLMVSFYQHPF